MISKELFRRAFWALLTTGVLNIIAVKLYLYWTVWWVDTVVHFFGGMWVAFISFWFLSLFFSVQYWSVKKVLLFALLASISVGIAWEFFELYFGMTSLSDGMAYVTDTSSDILMDTLGGTVAFIQLARLFKTYNTHA